MVDCCLLQSMLIEGERNIRVPTFAFKPIHYERYQPPPMQRRHEQYLNINREHLTIDRGRGANSRVCIIIYLRCFVRRSLFH